MHVWIITGHLSRQPGDTIVFHQRSDPPDWETTPCGEPVLYADGASWRAVMVSLAVGLKVGRACRKCWPTGLWSDGSW